MGHQHAAGAAHGAGQFEHQIAALTGEQRFAMSFVEADRFGIGAGGEQLAANVFGGAQFLAAGAGNRHHLQHEVERGIARLSA